LSLILSITSTLFVMIFFSTKNIPILLSVFAGLLIIYRYIYEIINYFLYKKFINPFSVIAHMSLGLLIVSISFNSLLSSERAINIYINEYEEYKDLKILFQDLGVEEKSNYDSIKAKFLVEDIKGNKFNLNPEKRKYFTRGQITTETAIHVTPLRDIYMTIGDQLDDGSWIVNIQINYLIRWIWISALLMGLAGIMLIFSKKLRA
jgi:cytochrome c-type biogenesis protein CcmF